MNKKVLILSNSDSGLFQFRGELIATLSYSNDVVCCTPSDDGYIDKLEALGCKCIVVSFSRHGTNPFKELKLIGYYRKVLKTEMPDIVLTYTIKPNVYGGLQCSSLKIPYITNVTGLGDSLENKGILQKVSLLLYKLGLRKANCVFFQNEANCLFFKNNKIVKGKYRIIPGSGVNTEKYCFQEYPIDESEFRLLFIARIKKDKGIEELLDAIHRVRKIKPKCIVEIVGSCEENYSEKLEFAVTNGDIRYYGQQMDVRPFYKNCHCVILPSYHEGTSNVLLEGLATGRPVIATRVPGCQELFDEGISGFGCEPKDSFSLVEAIFKIMKMSNQERATMGIAARKKINELYDRKIVIDAYLKEIEFAIKQSRGECK